MLMILGEKLVLSSCLGTLDPRVIVSLAIDCIKEMLHVVIVPTPKLK
jgi:hypothetical protein